MTKRKTLGRWETTRGWVFGLGGGDYPLVVGEDGSLLVVRDSNALARGELKDAAEIDLVTDKNLDKVRNEALGWVGARLPTLSELAKTRREVRQLADENVRRIVGPRP